MEKCPYCHDTGFISTGFVEKNVGGHRTLYPHTEPCYCKINISIGKKFGILSPVSMPHPEDSVLVHSEYGNNKNYIFYGVEDIFLYIVKCYFLKGFMYKNYIILEGGTIVEQYNVPRGTSGDWLTTSHLNQYDMMALMFTSSARYTSLKDCVSEVIKNRSRIAKPTWIYVYSEEHLKEAREYSVDLESYLTTYKHINLDTLQKFKGYVSRAESLIKNEKNLNDAVSNV